VFVPVADQLISVGEQLVPRQVAQGYAVNFLTGFSFQTDLWNQPLR
jgi:hypothetical protein